MVKENPIRRIIQDQKNGIACGIYSVCSAHPLVLEACVLRAKTDKTPLLIEATANQINQFGGYTGMQPKDFADMVYSLTDVAGIERGEVILGGDHLGPLVWADEPERIAMEKAETLIKLFVLAGFSKIHIDTSMRLKDDDINKPLSCEVIARRSAKLALAAERAFAELNESRPEAVHPVYVIGSEVPVPGGAQEKEEWVSVTLPDDAVETIETFEKYYAETVPEAWNHVVALVVQPGVEFGDDTIFDYDPEKAKNLIETGKSFKQIVFEGHSTDYQTPDALKAMVRDGIAILKVGPALTFSLREALFALADIEKELQPEKPSFFKERLENAMLRSPDNWIKHYRGTEKELAYKRKYSFSDRARYYLLEPDVSDAVASLLHNLENSIPAALISQYFPEQYAKVRGGILLPNAKELLLDRINDLLQDYKFAVTP